jgi:predicted aspartyl protease
LWAGSTTAFQLTDQGGVLVPVTMNGRGPFAMLLDTGATHSAITERVMTETGATAVARSNVISPTNRSVRLIVAVEAFSFGPHTVDILLPSVVGNDAFDRNGKIDGLIGQDVLAPLRYTVDYQRRVIEWHDHPPAAAGTVLPLAFEHGRFLVRVPVDQAMVRLVPDSGAGGLVLFGGHAISGPSESGRTVELASAGGRQHGRPIVVRELRLGRRTLRDIPGVALDRQDVHPAEGDGLLPLHLFERVTFDGPARILILG